MPDESHKDIAERAWNAALELADYTIEDFAKTNPHETLTSVGSLQAPSSAFDEWWEREVIHPPDTAWSADEYGV